MKKILGISLVALMSVTAANAEIASKAYVDSGLTAEETRATTVEGALGSLTTTAKGNLVAAINEVDEHADTNATGISNLTTLVGTGYGENTTVKQYIDAKASGDAGAAVAALDKTETAVRDGQTGQFVKGISETDGLVSATFGSIAEGSTNGTIAVDGADIAVHGLGSAAYTAATAYDAAGAASAAETAAKTHADDLNTAMDGRMDTAEGAITTLNGNAQTEGSVAYAVAAEAALRTQADTAINNKIGGDLPAGQDNIIDYIGSVASGATSGTTAAIEALDADAATATTGDGNVVTSVSEANGIVAAYKGITAVTVPASNENSTAGTYVLTSTIDGQGNKTYYWELIDRTYGD